MTRIFCFVCILLVFSGVALAQPPTAEWTDGSDFILPVEKGKVDALINEARSIVGPPAVIVDVYACPAPNALSSPSWPGWTANALNALENGIGSIGNPETDPTAFFTLEGTYTPPYLMVTSFKSWLGVANPASPFDQENGVRMHFCIHAFSANGTSTFILDGLYFSINSSDGALNFSGSYVGLNYNGTTRYGVNWGPDGVKGTSDDVPKYISGHGGDPVHDLGSTGPGNAYWPGGPGHPFTGQEAINDVVGYIYRENVSIICTFVLDAPGGGPYQGTVVLHLEDLIFSDGFESGNISAWSN